MSPRPDVSQQRRNQILEAAATVFSRLGFNKARMDDIAAQSGLSKGILYWYFNSKDAIITALLERVFAGSLEDLHTAQTSDEPVREQLLFLTRSFVREIRGMAALLPITFEFYAIATRHKTVKEFLTDFYRRYRVALAGMVRLGAARGEFRPVDAEVVANAVIALFEGLLLLYVIDPEAVDLESHGEQSVLLLLEGLKAPAIESRPGVSNV
ncbi:MAG: TetR/AcrR family transcriptional regulator [Chloroflexota bacterium]